MKIVPMFGVGIRGASPVITSQRRLNCYLEYRPDGDKTKVAILGTPGMTRAFTLTSPMSLPARAMLGTQSALYVLAYNTFYSLTGSGGVVFSDSSVGTVQGLATMAYSPTQVVLVDGGAGYLFTPAGPTFAPIAPSFPNGARTVTFVSGFFVAEQPGSQKFWVSNLFDGSTWDGLAFASASQYSDLLLAVDNLSGNLILFSENHMEFWQNTGATPQPFAPILSATNEWGLAAIFSRAHVEQSIIFLAQTREGQVQVCRLQGYGVNVISTTDIDNIFAGLGTISDAVAMVYQRDAHKFYQITFPTANRSFLFDCATQVWSETQTGVGQAARHIGNLSTYYAGKALISDWQNGNFYTPDPNNYTDNGNTIVRELVTRHAKENFNVFSVDEVYLDMETGVGLESGQGYDPQIMLQCSKTNGRTWLPERWQPLGKVGQYRRLPPWRRFGSCGDSRDMLFKIRMTDPVKFVIANGAMSIRERKQ